MSHLHIIRDLNDPLIELIRDDPVRPDIPIEFRVKGEQGEVFVLLEDQYLKPQAVVCVAYKDSVPKDQVELARVSSSAIEVAVFYTIWSYVPGAGRKLIQSVVSHLRDKRKYINQFVTLSPPTDMARVFHLRNGACVLSVNSDTINYLYS